MVESKIKSDVSSPSLPSSMSLNGRDEMNLADFPIALVAEKRSKEKTIYFQDEHGKLTVTGSDAYGLPTAVDADVLIALIYLTKIRNDFTDPKVYFSRYELIKLLNWRDEKDSYKRIDMAFNRWAGVLLVYEGCWWNNRFKCYTDKKMHIVHEAEIVTAKTRKEARLSGQGELPLSSFEWSKEFILSCQSDNLRLLNLDVYFSLKSAIAKRLYRFLGKRFYFQSDLTFDLSEIAFERVGLSRSHADASKLKERLTPALQELESIGFLKPLDPDKRFRRIDRGLWQIRLTKQSPNHAVPPAASADLDLSELSPLVAELTRRDIHTKVAVDLVERFTAKMIRLQIEAFDWMVAKKDKRIGKSPPGYLVCSIADNYALPKGFVPQAEKDRKKSEQRSRDAQNDATREVQRAAAAREAERLRRINAYWDSLSAEEKRTLQAQADAQADPSIPDSDDEILKSWGERIRRHDYISQLLCDQQTEPA